MLHPGPRCNGELTALPQTSWLDFGDRKGRGQGRKGKGEGEKERERKRDGNFSGNRVINAWNFLYDHYVSSPTVACLKHRIIVRLKFML